MLPDGLSMLRCIPVEFHRLVKDKDGESHDSVLISSSLFPQMGDFGITEEPEESLYVASPFDPPKGKLELSTDGGKTWRTRRYVRFHDHSSFVVIDLGVSV